MSSKLVFFTGAPEVGSLKTDSSIQLLSDLDERVARFCGVQPFVNTFVNDTSSFVREIPYWRSLPLSRRHLPATTPQNYSKKNDPELEANFLDFTYIDSSVDEISAGEGLQSQSFRSNEELLSQFYEESYGAFQNVPSSQIDIVSQATSSFMSENSGSDGLESFSSLQSTRQSVGNIPQITQLSSLKDLPNATYLNSINPQTMTVNLVVGIISVLEPRIITTRRGANVKLVEIITGDETKSGFVVNFWLPLNQDGAVLGTLRPRDIILIRNVALSCFRERVYGQSLRKDITKVYLLYRNKLAKTDPGGCYTTKDLEKQTCGEVLLEKTKSVRRWVQQFVGEVPGAPLVGETAPKEILPPNTPLSQP